MSFRLGSHNVFEYLIRHHLCQVEEISSSQIELKIGKNFNLLVTLPDDRQLLVKQEVYNSEGSSNGDLLHEWQLYHLIENLGLEDIRLLISEALHCDRHNSIVVFNYLKNYCDLDCFYTEQAVFPTEIAAALGITLADIHRHTIDRQEFITVLAEDDAWIPDFKQGLEHITPEIFGTVATDGLKFYELYQRYESLGQAIDRLNETYEPCCLTHSDIRFNNILLHLNWQTLLATEPATETSPIGINPASAIRLIDWEKWTWGDPAFDLGALLASYLKIWLKSLLVNPDIEIELVLRLAAIPLEQLQPSMIALIRAYLQRFPEILEYFPDFVTRTLQFTGFALIESLQARVHYYEPFGNTGICMLQVAKVLLCEPEKSVPIIFGMSVAALTDRKLSGSATLQNQFPKSSLSNSKITVERIIHHESDVISSAVKQNVSIDVEKNHAASSSEGILSDSILDNMSQNDMLQDIVRRILIQDSCQILHPRYKPLQLSDSVVRRFHKLPSDLQRDFLKTQLRNYLYDIYCSGEQEPALNYDRGVIAQENNSVRGVDVEFYKSLQRANAGTGYFDSGWLVLKSDRHQNLIVKKYELTLHVAPDRHLHSNNRTAVPGEFVALCLPAYQIENGFYIAISNQGIVDIHQDSIELCFNLNPEGAVAALQELTKSLNALAIPFTFKVLLEPSEYQRHDSGVLQIGRHEYAMIRPVLQQFYHQHRSHFSSRIPLMTKCLAPGVGLAEEPESKDFGLDRCETIAEGLLSTWEQGSQTAAARLHAIQQLFSQQQIDWYRPYLNPHSQDIYTPLDR